MHTINTKIIMALFFYIVYFLNFSINASYKKIPKKELFLHEIEKNSKLQTDKSEQLFAEIRWEKVNPNPEKNNSHSWESYFQERDQFLKNSSSKDFSNKKTTHLSSFNRSIVFNNDFVGPDISWIVPPGLSWNKKYKFDITARGHNTKIPEPKKRDFFGWNDGDAVGLISYQFLHQERSSFGLNLGVRSLYQGNQSLGGTTSIGEGLSSGFRWDYAFNEKTGLAFGAEQLLHFDNTTDTGRNIYLTFSKAWWTNENKNEDLSFPIYVGTAGIGTGRMAVGTIKGLCTDLLGGSGTETETQRSLCWAPVFSIARVWNEKFSTYFEYNSRFFLLGSSLAPNKNIPIRGNLALILSDHVDNYKLHDFSELNWVFNLSLGF